MSFLDSLQSAALAALHTTANSLHADFATKLAQAGHDVSPDDHADKLVAAATTAVAKPGEPPTYADHALAQFTVGMTGALLQFASAHLPDKFKPLGAAVEQAAETLPSEPTQGDLLDEGLKIAETVAAVAIPGAAPVLALAEAVAHAVEGGQSVQDATVSTVGSVVEQVAESAAEKALPGIGGELAGAAVQAVEQALEKPGA